MKCPKCGGAPDDMVLTSMPPQRRCSSCGFTGTEVAWMESAKKEHVERLQAAREKVANWSCQLNWQMRPNEYEAISQLIDAKVTLALLERGGG